VSGQLHASTHVRRGNNRGIHLIRYRVGTRDVLNTGVEKDVFFLPGFEIWIVHPVAWLLCRVRYPGLRNVDV